MNMKAITILLLACLAPSAYGWNDLAKDQWTGQIKSSTFRPVFLDVRDCLVDLNGFDVDGSVLYDSYGRLMATDAKVYDSAGYEVNRYCNR